MITFLTILIILAMGAFIWALCRGDKEPPPVEDYEAIFSDGKFDYHIVDWRKKETV